MRGESEERKVERSFHLASSSTSVRRSRKHSNAESAEVVLATATIDRQSVQLRKVLADGLMNLAIR